MIGGGILIASEDDLDQLFQGPEPFDLDIIPGCNIRTGSYGLFLIALDQCDDPTEKATLEEALEATDAICDCVASGAMTMYYRLLPHDYSGILRLADVFIFLADVAKDKHELDFTQDEMVKIDQQVSEILEISTEDAVKDFFASMGFTPVEIPNDGPRQLDLFE